MRIPDSMEKKAIFLFCGELKDLLKMEQSEGVIVCEFRGRQSVKHLIESLQVPHTEVGRIRIGNEVVDFNYIVKDNDFVSVEPVLDDSSIPIRKFVNDNHLGKLSTYMRILGFDVLYRNDFQDEELAEIASQDKRVLLTRDRALLMRRVVINGFLIRSREPRDQLEEVLKRFDLFEHIRPFKRCLSCNKPLDRISKEEVMDRLQPLTKRYYNEFHICKSCDKIYWKGSHYERMEAFLNEILQAK